MKKNLIRVCLLVFIVLLTSCALLRQSAESGARVQIGKDQSINLPRPAALGFNLTATQLLTATYHINGKTDSYSSQVQIDVNQQHIILVALSGFGSELFSLNYDGEHLKSSSLPMPNAQMGVQQTLTEFILSYAPSTLIRALLKNTNISLHTTARQRIFMQNHKVLIKIDYASNNRFKGKVVLHNNLYNYTITINTISYQLKQTRGQSTAVGA
jgi:hypothetical protein